MNGWKGVRLGRLGICCVKKENVLWKVHSAVWHLFLFVRLLVLIFISSYQVKLGYLGLVLVDCRKFCALFLFLFFNLLRSFFPPSFSFWAFIFPKQILEFFFFQKSPILEFTCWDSLNSSPPCFCYCFDFLSFTFEVTAFCSKFSFIKGEPAQFRFHSSEFSVSIMHFSLLS